MLDMPIKNLPET